LEGYVKVSKDIQDNICTLRVRGVLDYSTMNPFLRETESIEKETAKVIIDFTGLDFIDSTGIGSIINLVHESADKNMEIQLTGMKEEVKHLFDTVGLFSIMEMLQKEGV
jgi:anti-anti-sigma factor